MEELRQPQPSDLSLLTITLTLKLPFLAREERLAPCRKEGWREMPVPSPISSILQWKEELNIGIFVLVFIQLMIDKTEHLWPSLTASVAAAERKEAGDYLSW